MHKTSTQILDVSLYYIFIHFYYEAKIWPSFVIFDKKYTIKNRNVTIEIFIRQS